MKLQKFRLLSDKRFVWLGCKCTVRQVAGVLPPPLPPPPPLSSSASCSSSGLWSLQSSSNGLWVYYGCTSTTRTTRDPFARCVRASGFAFQLDELVVVVGVVCGFVVVVVVLVVVVKWSLWPRDAVLMITTPPPPCLVF